MTTHPHPLPTPTTSTTAPPDPLDELGFLLHDALDLRAAAQATVDVVRRLLDADAVGLARHDPDGPVVLAATSADVLPLYAVDPGTWPLPPPGSHERVLADGTGVLSAHLRSLGAEALTAVGLAPLRMRPVTLDVLAAADAPEMSGATTSLLRYAGLVLQCHDRVENLHTAMRTREVIAQAQGILRERFALDEAQAMNVLKRWSQQSNTKVRTIAEHLVRDHHASLPGRSAHPAEP